MTKATYPYENAQQGHVDYSVKFQHPTALYYPYENTQQDHADYSNPFKHTSRSRAPDPSVHPGIWRAAQNASGDPTLNPRQWRDAANASSPAGLGALGIS